MTPAIATCDACYDTVWVGGVGQGEVGVGGRRESNFEVAMGWNVSVACALCRGRAKPRWTNVVLTVKEVGRRQYSGCLYVSRVLEDRRRGEGC